ncbi:haloacid dehalogenase [Thiocapsa imhoffii]|uniref:Haloacid dehalogenase n=1 Tax=Thiocapsa imhoffii TaxID=382777 RepID=A0A9X1B885_9GAMM|nr:HAD-IIB family hydrolase [Thiocapsa imhoffii]MBK1643998.1 haloacid dehalogenase [Thiocapsa imhoffii]
MTPPLLLCTDLDRTLIPNGSERESPDARPRFRRFVANPQVTLVYVTGRHEALVRKAIAEYDLPTPDFVICDVGTSLYHVTHNAWQPVTAWRDAIAPDWAGQSAARFIEVFADLTELRLQEPERQGRFKLSYETPCELDVDQLKERLQQRLAPLHVKASLIWSIDEAAGVGLLDVLPASATKFHAVDFLMRRLGHDHDTTVFAGDSGNDLEVLISPIPAVLVANGHPEVRAEAQKRAVALGLSDRLYCARGDWSGMNGHYSAGILEGIAHFRPDLTPALTATAEAR